MRIAVLGTSGLVGESFCRNLSQVELLLSRNDVDFFDTETLTNILRVNQINTVINCAAVVGGIELNRKKPYDMFSHNIALSESILKSSIASGVNDLVQFCSNCSYPVSVEQPYKESDMFNGPAHELNKGYAAAKIAAVHSGQCAENQGLIRVYHPVPCSLFGNNDNYNKDKSHFVAAAIRKIYEAKQNNHPSIIFWGTGKPYREFMYVDNLVSAVLLMLNKRITYHPVNIGPGIDTPIKSIIEIISQHANYSGKIIWDTTKPDGALHKLLDTTIIKSNGWTLNHQLNNSLSITYDHYSRNICTLRR